MALSPKCMSFKHETRGVCAKVKHNLSKPLPEKWKEISLLQKNPEDSKEASPTIYKDLGSKVIYPWVRHNQLPGHYLFLLCMCGEECNTFFGCCGLHEHYSCLFPGLYKLGKSPCVQPILGVSASAIVREPAFHHSAGTSQSHNGGRNSAEVKQCWELVRNVNDIAAIVSNISSIVLTVISQLKKCWGACMMKLMPADGSMLCQDN